MKKRHIIAAVIFLLATCLGIYSYCAQADKAEIPLNFTPVNEEDVWLAQAGETAYTGTLYESAPFSLDKGEYFIDIGYFAEKTNSLQLICTATEQGNTLTEYVHTSFDILPVAEDFAQYTLVLDKPVKNAVFRIVYNGGGFTLWHSQMKLATSYADSVFWAVLTFILGMAAIVYICTPRGQAAVSAEAENIINGRHGQMFAILLCIAAGLIASIPIMRTSVMNGGDIAFHLSRIEGISGGLSAGQFPVRVNTAFSDGLGYNVSMMYPELFLYIPAVLRLCGVSLLGAYQFYIIILNIATAVIMYITATKLTHSHFTGLLASVMYTMSIYRLTNIYRRAAIGEATAMVFLPCVLLGLYEVFKGNEKKYGWLVFGVWGVLNSHVLSLQMCAIAGVIYALLCLPAVMKKSRIWSMVKSVVIVCGLGASFLIPFILFSRQDMHVYHIPYWPSATALTPLRFFYSDGSWTALGAALLAAIPVYIAGYLVKKDFSGKSPRLEKIGSSLLIAGIVFMFLSSIFFPWGVLENLPAVGKFFQIIQFPWRYLAFASVALSIAGALAIYRFKPDGKKGTVYFAAAALLVVSLAVTPLVKTAYSQGDMMKTRWDFSFIAENLELSYYPHGQKTEMLVNAPIHPSAAENTEIIGFEKSGTNVTFSYEAKGEPGLLDIPLYYYPGYKATLNGENLPVHRASNGLIFLHLPDNTPAGTVTLWYSGMWYYRVGDAISLVFTAGILVYWLTCRIKKRRQKAEPSPL